MENRRIELENKLTYGKGLTYSEWDELEALRVENLKSKGLNPADWNIKSRQLTRKM